jgi:hypothetical protein
METVCDPYISASESLPLEEPLPVGGVQCNVWSKSSVVQIVFAVSAAVFLSLGTCSWFHAPVLGMLTFERWKVIGWAGIALIGLSFGRMGMYLIPLALSGAIGTWLGCGLATWLTPSHAPLTLLGAMTDAIIWFSRETATGAVTMLAAGLVVRSTRR